MSNPEGEPDEVAWRPAARRGVEVMEPREVPLGGPRAMTVRRTLPQRERSLIGAWCFLDHYGPDDVADDRRDERAPHPHTGLQTVSWLFTGEIEHRDSAGHHAMVRPGRAQPDDRRATASATRRSRPPGPPCCTAPSSGSRCPTAARDGDPAFDHHAPDRGRGDGLGGPGLPRLAARRHLAGRDRTPRCSGAELVLDAGTSWSSTSTRPSSTASWSTPASSVVGGAEVEAARARPTLAARPRRLDARRRATDARVLLLGGPPFGEAIVMWWNFVGRTHEEVVAFREEWQAQIVGDGGTPTARRSDGRFGVVVGDHLPPIPAPALPNARLRERR